jgi:hypothetical protein
MRRSPAQAPALSAKLGTDLSHVDIPNWPSVDLSRIPTTENKIHHLGAEIGHDDDHPFHEKMLWAPAVKQLGK